MRKKRPSNKKIQDSFLPDEKKQELDELADRYDKVHALAVVGKTEAGEVLLESLKKDASGIVDQLVTTYQKLDHIELIQFCASLKSNLDIIRALKNAEQQAESYAEIMQELLGE